MATDNSMGSYKGTLIPKGSTPDQISAIIKAADAPKVPTPITKKNSTPTIGTDAINTPSTVVPGPKNRSQTLASDLGMSVNGMTEADKKALDNVSGFVPADTMSPLEKSQQSLLEKVYAGFEKLTGKKAFIKDEYANQGLEEKQKALIGYDNQLKQEQRALDIETRRLQENPEGKLSGNLNAQIADVQRKSLQKQADIAILKSAAQGDITTAQNIIDQKVELEFGEVQDQVDLAKEYLNLIQPSLSAEEKKKAQKQAMFLDERQRLLDDEKTQKKEAMDIGLEVAKNGNASLANQIFQLANSGQVDKAISLGMSGGGLYTAPKGSGTMSDRQEAYYDDLSYYVEQGADQATIQKVLGLKYPEYRNQIASDIGSVTPESTAVNQEVNNIAAEYSLTPEDFGVGTRKVVSGLGKGASYLNPLNLTGRSLTTDTLKSTGGFLKGLFSK